MSQKKRILKPVAISVVCLLSVFPGRAVAQIWKTDSTLPPPNQSVWVSPRPEMIHYEEPEYPAVSREAGHQGYVIVKALLDKDGIVLDAIAYRSSGHPLLDRAAIEAAFKCKWTPAYRDNFPIAYWTKYPVEFVLEEKESDTEKETRSFAILLVKEEPPVTKDALPEGEIRVWGGFNDGLDDNMIGTISRESRVYGEIPIADVYVTWVQGEESLCHYEMRDPESFIKPWDRVSFTVTKPRSSAILERGLHAFSEGRAEEALSYLDDIWCLARDNQFVAQVTEQCLQHLNSRTAADLSRSERAAWRRQTLDFLRLAQRFNESGNPHMAWRYVNRVLLIDSANQMALRLLDSIPEYDYYEDKIRRCNRYDSVLAGTVIPEIDEYVPVDTAARLVSHEQPKFPALTDCAFGSVRIKLLIGSDGEILDAVVYESSGHETLDNAALENARKCVYEPAIARGQPITTWVSYSVDFVLY